MRKRSANRFDVAGAQGVRGKDFYEIRAGLMRALCLGGGISAQHHRPVSRMCGLGNLRTQNGTYDKLSACGNCVLASLRIQHSADSDEGPRPKVAMGRAD